MSNKPAVCVKTFKGAPHGHTTFTYNPGDPIPAELAAEAVSNGWAVYQVEVPQEKPAEDEAVDRAAELAAMSVEQLKALAAEYELEIPRGAKKGDVVKMIADFEAQPVDQ